MGSDSITTKLLKQFRPLDSFPERDLILAAAKCHIKSFAQDEVVLALDSKDDIEYFLLSGTVELESFDSRIKEVASGSDSAKTAIALLQPRKYTVKAKTACKFILVPISTIKELLRALPKSRDVEFSASDVGAGKEIEEIAGSFRSDLETNNIELPSCPDIAIHIRKVVDDPNVTAKKVAAVIQNDLAITTKLLKTCNGPLYRTVNEIVSCNDAVSRLGLDTTRQLVTVFALKEVFSSKSDLLQTKMKELWGHSREVAALSYVLAEITPGLDPSHAMLCGLVQDIGEIPIFSYLERYPRLIKDSKSLMSVLHALGPSTGAALLDTWQFPREFIESAQNSRNWTFRSSDAKASYTDVAIVAQLHALIGKNSDEPLPKFSDVHALQVLGDDGLSPEQSQKILHDSHAKIDELKALLTG